MDVIPVTDPADTRLERFRHLRDADLLRAHGLFVAEGRFVVERVLADPRLTFEALLLNRASLDALRHALEGRISGSAVFECPTQVFESIIGYNFHRGCLALVRRLPALPWQAAVGSACLIVALEGVTNADNVGAVFRNAASFGAGAVLLSPTCCDPLYRKAIRASMGHVLRVPFARVEPWPDAMTALHASGFTVAALSPRGAAMTLDAFAATHRDKRVALLVGSEGTGLSDAAGRVADLRVRIPMAPGIDSLNLAVATGIALSSLRLSHDRAL
jgi:tRNA G18 (ribose-2'-O)-methylase SpoU